MAAVSGISMAPHACEGPIGGLATLHVDAAMPNFVVQEICGQIEPERRPTRSGRSGSASRPCAWWTGDSRFPQKPGLGFELTEASLAKYPFGGTRPMARVFHEDGSVAEW